ncbi:MAG TPA: ABC transporter permease [Acidobacteriota bacterium]|nr:ABC transporter permease [Acidobacteriota bacterium]
MKKLFAGKPERRRFGTALWEAICIAVDSIWTHKLRSVLTLLGIIIGVASVVTVGGAIGGLNSYVSDRLSASFAGNTFMVARFARMNVSSEEFEKIIQRNKNIYPVDMHAVEERCVECVAISPIIQRRDDVKRGGKTFYDAAVQGVSDDMPRIQAIDLDEGRFFSEPDVTHSRAYAVIGAQVRDELFGPVDPIGKEIRISGDRFVVIGVEVRKGSMMGQSMDNNIYIPYTMYLKKYGLNQSIQFRVRAPSEEMMEATQDEVRQIMRARHKLRPAQEDVFDILASQAVQEMVGQMTGAIAMVVTPITLISLVVGGIVVMNIMLVTVTERTVEIGTRKAVGAKRKDILLQFLVESGLLASIGGTIGIMVSYLLSVLIQAVTPVPMHITIGYIVIALITSGGVGLISGIYPAYKASKLNPIVALMRE